MRPINDLGRMPACTSPPATQRRRTSSDADARASAPGERQRRGRERR